MGNKLAPSPRPARILAANEFHQGEARVALTPETTKKLIALGFEVCVEAGAGLAAHYLDSAYAEAGAQVVDDVRAAVADTHILLSVRPPSPALLGSLGRGTVVIGMLDPHRGGAIVTRCAEAGLTAFSLELAPRITRAQSMDVLSSQSNLAGYKAVIDAASTFDRAMPMMMTAAGTVAPARVLVMGAGVAGLQAIATARRLGAIVSATDVRPAAKEQVESLGATFLSVDSDEALEAETAGGYAREMSADYQRRQAELIATTLPKQDIVILTALTAGRAAPILLTEAMVRSMQPGAVIVDLAVEQGGNCPLSRPGEVVVHHGVTILGHQNVPGRLARDASSLYARNLLAFVAPLVPEGAPSATEALRLDWEDDIITGTALTHAGAVIHPDFAPAMGSVEMPSVEPANGD